MDSDGTLTKEKSPLDLFGNTKSSGRQMSDQWVNDRLEKEIGDKARDVRHSGYEKWLMIVEPDGKIEAIHKLNPGAIGIKQTVKPRPL